MGKSKGLVASDKPFIVVRKGDHVGRPLLGMYESSAYG